MENKIITSLEAQKILGISRSRISILLKQGRIGTREKGISYLKVLEYKKKRKVGRPLGSYKKEQNLKNRPPKI